MWTIRQNLLIEFIRNVFRRWSLAIRAPNNNAFVERFTQTIQQECLDHFVILDKRHFNKTY